MLTELENLSLELPLGGFSISASEKSLESYKKVGNLNMTGLVHQGVITLSEDTTIKKGFKFSNPAGSMVCEFGQVDSKG